MESAPHPSAFRLTGRMVFVGLVLFFATIAAVNAVMIRAATLTFGGVETENAYQAGLAFNRAHAAAVAQDGRHWSVAAELTRGSDNSAMLVVSLLDGAGAPVSGVAVDARVAHPADARRDRRIALREKSPGTFQGSADVSHGQWDLLLDVARAGEHLFRSKSRVVLR
jgi:nitrogen fixation protein FixH